MASSRRTEKSKSRGRNPAITPEGRENQLINQAVDLAERQIQEGTASAQVISHYLKLGSSRERLEQDRLRQENAMLEAKIDQLKQQTRIDTLYEEAIIAMRTYSGQDQPELEAGYDEYADD